MPSPLARHGHALGYDSARGRVVLFGGINDSTGYLSDTWEWDGNVWTQRTPAQSPPARGVALAYDSARGRIVLFGGYNGFYLCGLSQFLRPAETVAKFVHRLS